jgi:tRNA U38,U39,U40 pseudouridine synthase TruA
VGAGKLLLSDIEEIFKAKKRTGRIVSAPAKGLCLEEVFYHSSK